MSRTTVLFALFTVFTVYLASPVVADVEKPVAEIRGFWVDAFNPGIKTKEEVDTLIARLQRANCNAVFVQVRKRGDAYYFSHYEPRATDIAANWDPLRYLIERAHAARPRIAVHAWINTCAVGGVFAPGHILGRNPSWRSLSDKGEAYDNEAVKIDPGVPDAEEWTYRVYLDVARSYDVDGIHFDFVRYGGAHWGYAPVSVARFNARYGRQGTPAFDDALWQQWRRDQVTALVRKVYANAVAIRPNIIVSGALIAWGDGPKSEADWTATSAYSAVFQDWRGWLEEGILDLGCPMTYFSRRSYQEHWAEYVKEHQYRRASTVAVGAWLNTPPETFDLIRINQKPSEGARLKAAGTLLYAYSGTNAVIGADGKRAEQEYNDAFYDALATGLPGDPLPPPFAGKAEFPALLWKAHPNVGHVKGTVFAGSALAWADGAAITLEGAGGFRRTQTADGTGFFAFVDLAPGEYRVAAAYQGETTEPRVITVRPGEVIGANFTLSSGDLPPARTVFGIGSEREGTRVYLPERLVTAGSDVLGDNFMLVDAVGGSAVTVRTPKNLVLPLVRGDRVTVIGTMRHEKGLSVIVADAVPVVGSESLSDEYAVRRMLSRPDSQ